MFDIHRPSVIRQLVRWIRSGKLWYIHFGTPCTAWSVTTASTSKPKHEALGLTAIRVTLRLVAECFRHNVFWTLENPWSSGMFRYAPVARLLRRPSVAHAYIDMCEYQAHYKKPTAVIGTLPELHLLSRSCLGGHVHDILQGTVHVGGHKVWRTSLAAAYPPALCRRWAGLALEAAPASAWRPPGDNGHADLCRWEACVASTASCTGPVGQFIPKCPRGHPREWPADAAGWGSPPSRWIPPRWSAPSASPPGCRC